MSGMAILLLCTFQVDQSGWRMQGQRSPAEPAGVVQSSGGATLSDSAEQLLEQTGRALDEGLSEAEAVIRRQGERGIEQVRELFPDSGPGRRDGRITAPAGWTEIEHALDEPVTDNPATTRPGQATLRDRMRRAQDSIARPPRPPVAANDLSHSPTGSNRASEPLAGQFDESSLGSGSRAAVADYSTADGPASDVFQSAGDRPLRVSQSVDRSGAALLSDAAVPIESDGASRGEREVIFEGDPRDTSAARERYLAPPTRDEGLLARQPTGHEVAATNNLDLTGPGGDGGRTMALPTPPSRSTARQTGDTERRGGAPADAAETPRRDRPWGPLLLAVLGLFGSLGLNLYLSWIAWDLYSRHQDAVDDIQELEAKLETKQQELATVIGPRPMARRTSAAAG